MAFEDRVDAGRKLAAALAHYKDKSPAVLALPRGGVPVAAEIAIALEAPLDLILVRKIGVPGNRELAMGAVVDGTTPIVVKNEDIIKLIGIAESEFKAVCDHELKEIDRRRVRYLGGRERINLAHRTTIVVDDGIATGATMRAALQATRARNPDKLVLAVPVAPTDALPALRKEVDDLICLEDHEAFGAIGYYYLDFRQVSDEEVIEILKQFPASSATTSAA